MATKELVPTPETSGYLEIYRDPDVAMIVKENIGGSITPFMLPRVRIPAGGGVSFSVPNEAGEIVPLQEITGIVLFSLTWRGYWAEEYTGGSLPPDCASKDGVYGEGSPGGECGKCPLNKWGSDSLKSGRGKACKEMRALFVLREGDIFPTLLVLPPTSLKDMTNYMMNLANKRRPYWSVVTGIKLGQEKNADGIAYSVARPRMLRELSDEEREGTRLFRIEARPMAEQQIISQDDVAS